MSVQQDSLAVWLDAMRRADLSPLAELYSPDVVWRGVPADAICHNREDALPGQLFNVHACRPPHRGGSGLRDARRRAARGRRACTAVGLSTPHSSRS